MGTGEHALLTRSFSHPSRETKEGDPFRALTESISFGRFMTESLAWEKWSTFSHNRYLEEVEKFSKPGSVAQKKAFFEAHYKKRAAMKAAALLEQTKSATENVAEEKTEPENCTPSSLPSISDNESSSMISTEWYEDEFPDTGATSSVNANSSGYNGQSHHLQNANREARENPDCSPKHSESADKTTIIFGGKECEEEVIGTEINCLASLNEYPDGQRENVQNPTVERFGEVMEILELESATKTTGEISGEEHKKKIADAKITLSDDADRYLDSLMDNSDGPSKESCNGIIEQCFGVETPRQVENSKQFVNDSDKVAKEEMPDKVIGKETIVTQSHKRQMSSSLKSPSEIRVSKLPKSSAKQALHPKGGKFLPPICKNSAEELTDKKRSISRSIHMSINFTSYSGAASKRVSRDSSAIRNPTRTSVNGALKILPSKNCQTVETRKKSVLNQSASGGLVTNGIPPAPSEDSNLKSSSKGGNEVRPRIISSPFSLRSEERAVKRKEFFQKLEEEKKAKEAEKTHLILKLKEKTDLGHRRNLQSTCFGAPSSEVLKRGPQSPSNLTKKIPVTRPRSPKLGRKPMPCLVKQQNSISKTESSTKHVVPRSTQSIHHSVVSLPKKKSPENTSPNIQL